MIILEGPDNSGKSRLGKYLARLFCTIVEHSERPAKGLTPEGYLTHAIHQLRERPVILDRVYALSEVVYGTVIRGNVQTKDKTKDMLHALANSNHLIIYCRPPTQTIIEPNGRRQMNGVIENHLSIINFYDTMIKQWKVYGSKVFILEYDWTNPNALDELNPIVEAYWRDNYDKAK